MGCSPQHSRSDGGRRKASRCQCVATARPAAGYEAAMPPSRILFLVLGLIAAVAVLYVVVFQVAR